MRLANSGDPDQMPHYAVSDLGLHCLPMHTFYGFPTTMGYCKKKKGIKTSMENSTLSLFI